MGGEVRRFADPESVALEGAQEFVRTAEASLRERSRFAVALAGGSTPRRMLELLAEAPLRDQVDWARVLFFFGDERLVPQSHADSNFRMASEALAEGSPAPDKSPPAETPPRFDLVYLGIGEDGHTASLFPGTAALSERSRWVVANAVPQLETTRITLTFPVLAAARRVVFMACGLGKARPIAEIFLGRTLATQLPAARVNPTQGELIWLLDEAAASRIAL